MDVIKIAWLRMVINVSFHVFCNLLRRKRVEKEKKDFFILCTFLS